TAVTFRIPVGLGATVIFPNQSPDLHRAANCMSSEHFGQLAFACVTWRPRCRRMSGRTSRSARRRGLGEYWNTQLLGFIVSVTPDGGGGAGDEAPCHRQPGATGARARSPHLISLRSFDRNIGIAPRRGRET